MSWTISVIGAFDRFNYGDVLFAKVSEHMLVAEFPDAEIDFFELKAADLRNQGGVVTRPLKALYTKRPAPGQNHLVMLACGELLAPSWMEMAEHLFTPTVGRQLRRIQRRTPNWMWSRFWQKALGCPNLQPWTINQDDLQAPERTAVVYNAVGGTSVEALQPKELQWQTVALERAAWLSVRDRTADAIQARGLARPEVTPDSAVVMRVLLSDRKISSLRTGILTVAGLTEEPYLCVQLAERWSHGCEQLIAGQLEEVHRRTGLNVLSFAIGRAAGHEDQVTGQRLMHLLGKHPWFGVAKVYRQSFANMIATLRNRVGA